MDKSKLASFGERLKTQGAQMGRMVSTKMKDLMQTPTPESKMVDEATSETLPEPNWGLNLRICAMINAEELGGTEVVRAIKRKLCGKSVAAQQLSLELLEACAMNCDKVFSELASEKVVEEMVRIIDNPQVEADIRRRCWDLIRAWGESEDLAYLPVFRQTYVNLKARGTPLPPEDGNSLSPEYSLESYIDQQPVGSSEGYPIPDMHNEDDVTFNYNYSSLSAEEKKEFLTVTRNSLDVLSSILNSGTEWKSSKDDLVISMLEKCKQSVPNLQRIIESTGDDEVMLFEALNLHDELQQVISRCEGLDSAAQSGDHPSEVSTSPKFSSASQDAGTSSVAREAVCSKEESITPESDKMNIAGETRIAESPKEEATETTSSASSKKDEKTDAV